MRKVFALVYCHFVHKLYIIIPQTGLDLNGDFVKGNVKGIHGVFFIVL